MRLLTLRIVIAIGVLAVLASPAQAQRRRMRGGRAVAAGSRPEIGGHIGYNFDASEGVIGAQASFPVTPQVDFYPSFDFYTVSGGSLWALNFDLRARPPIRFEYWYVGAGLNLTHASAGGFSNTDTNLNLLAGLEARRGPMRPYAEFRIIVGNGTSSQIVGGLNFALR